MGADTAAEQQRGQSVFACRHAVAKAAVPSPQTGSCSSHNAGEVDLLAKFDRVSNRGRGSTGAAALRLVVGLGAASPA